MAGRSVFTITTPHNPKVYLVSSDNTPDAEPRPCLVESEQPGTCRAVAVPSFTHPGWVRLPIQRTKVPVLKGVQTGYPREHRLTQPSSQAMGWRHSERFQAPQSCHLLPCLEPTIFLSGAPWFHKTPRGLERVRIFNIRATNPRRRHHHRRLPHRHSNY